MDTITLQNYRCFGVAPQTARLAPLTLLVGPNGTGKTSFLALVRALWDVAFGNRVPNFREAPYDLGSFQDIVHRRGGRGKDADCFAAGFEHHYPPVDSLDRPAKFDATFANRRTAPYPVVRRFGARGGSIKIADSNDGTPWTAKWRSSNGKWDTIELEDREVRFHDEELVSLLTLSFLLTARDRLQTDAGNAQLKNILPLIESSFPSYMMPITRPVASAPVQSRPFRTYDPVQLAQDPHGASVPSYLASLYRNDPDEWQRLKTALDDFGQSAGLFDEIAVRSFGNSDGDPFQLQVRKASKRHKGPWRNLIDAGYGVSQALPPVVELLKAPDSPLGELPEYRPPALLLQQPEVHLHPQAGAALGTLFCSAAAAGRQLLVETHSDYIIDRVRMDVRDKTTDLKPEDVSILYFEPGDLEVKIHSIRLDDMGNVLDAPPGYRQFFTDEMMRSVGF